MPPASSPSPAPSPTSASSSSSSGSFTSPPPALPVLTPEIKALIKSTAPLLASHGPSITQVFYPLLFSRFPCVRQLFNKRNQAPEPDGSPARQPQALANAVWAYAANIDNLSALSAAISLIAHKHASLNVLPEHYPMVGECLLAAIEQVLGKEVATEGVLSAWGQAYGFLAAVFIQTEDGLREKNARKRHGWVGWKEMQVARKVKETVDVTSFYLTNLDAREPVCSYLPGQYISLKLSVPNCEVEERDYSLSEFALPSYSLLSSLPASASASDSATSTTTTAVAAAAAAAAGIDKGKEEKGEDGRGGNDTSPPYFRISIKRLPGGVVSTYMHDQVEEGSVLLVGPPYGDFTLPPSPPPSGPSSSSTSSLPRRRPLVFLSAGIGITPLLCMAESALLGSNGGNSGTPSLPPSLPPKVFFLHTARDPAHFPFASRLQSLISSFPSRLTCHVSFTKELTEAGWEEGGREGGKDGGCLWGSGRLTAATLHEALGNKARPQDCTFYFCGPTEYMVGVRRLLAWLGVPGEEVKYECFGPAVTEIEAAGVVPSCY